MRKAGSRKISISPPPRKRPSSWFFSVTNISGKYSASLMLEGGSELNAGFLREGLVNQVYLYMSPSLLGGQNAKGLIGGISPEYLAEKFVVENVCVKSFGDDFLVTGDLSS